MTLINGMSIDDEGTVDDRHAGNVDRRLTVREEALREGREAIQVRVRKPVGAVLAVRMPREMVVALSERAQAEGRTVSDTVRRAIDAYLGGTYSTSSAIALQYEARALLAKPEESPNG